MHENEADTDANGAAQEGGMGPRHHSLLEDCCWRHFRQWVHCFCVVTFDLELGQTIEVVYPGDAELSAQERSDLCYLAFPDSNSSSAFSHSSRQHSSSPLANGATLTPGPSDSTHHFRIRRTMTAEEEGSLNALEHFPSAFVDFLPAVLRPDKRFLNGFAYFRQQKDASLPRGYFQKSIVLVSPLPFVALFSRVLAEVALAFFLGGESAIETACLQIDRHWPNPMPGVQLSLPLFGLRLQCTIPAHSGAWNAQMEHLDLAKENGKNAEIQRDNNRVCLEIEQGETDDGFEFVECNSSTVRLDSVHEQDQHFHIGIKRLVPHLQLLWELVLLGEPLLVVAPSAALCSSLVHSLHSLVAPLHFHGDHRPFFTIHDSDFNEIAARQNCCVNSFLLGVTNPFFLKALAHWPHILKLGPARTASSRERSAESKRILRQLVPAPALGLMRRSGTAPRDLNEELDGENGRNGQIHMLRRLSDRGQLERRSGGLLSSHKQHLFQDKSLVRKLLRTPRDSASQWHTLRRHFLELTQSFIGPLERHLASMLPLRRQLCPFQPIPPPSPFSLERFLASLRHFGHPGVKGDWQGLYRQFVARSPNFIGWLQERRREIERQLRAQHLELLCNADLSPQVLAQRTQVEIVDLVLRLRDRLAELEAKKGGIRQQKGRGRRELAQHHKRGQSASPMKSPSDLADRQRAQLQQQLNRLLSSVDEELKHVLLSNTALRRAARDQQSS